jgi:hypothetical protein
MEFLQKDQMEKGKWKGKSERDSSLEKNVTLMSWAVSDKAR